MKREILSFAIAVIFLSGCTGVKTISTGLENEAYLEFAGNPDNYQDGVNVNIDDKSIFMADVNKQYQKRPKGKVYAISTGTHMVTVSYHNNVIFKKQIFVAAQETKRIILP